MREAVTGFIKAPMIFLAPVILMVLVIARIFHARAITEFFIVWWLCRGRIWLSWLVRRINERKYITHSLPDISSFEDIEACIKQIKWTWESPLHVFNCIHYPQRTWAKKKGDGDDFANLVAELIYSWQPNLNPVLITATTIPFRNNATVCAYNDPQGSLRVFINSSLLAEEFHTYDEIAEWMGKGAQRIVCWDIRNPITLEMLECHIPNRVPGEEKRLVVERNANPVNWSCTAQHLQCLHYNIKEKRCVLLDRKVGIDGDEPKEERCGRYQPAISHVIDKYHIRSSSFYSFITAAVFSVIPLVISYFIPSIASAIILGLLVIFLAFQIKFGFDELNENHLRGLRFPYLRLRSLIGALCLILAPVIQILFVYNVISLNYLSWIFLTGGLALAINKMDIDIVQMEDGTQMPEVTFITPALAEEKTGLNQKPFAMRLAVPERIKKGINTVMSVFVANNTNEARTLELSYNSPCFAPETDRVSLTLNANKADKVNFVVFVKGSGGCVVNTRLLDSGKAIHGISKHISIIAPATFREPLTVVRSVMGLITLVIAAIKLIPDIVKLFQ